MSLPAAGGVGGQARFCSIESTTVVGSDWITMARRVPATLGTYRHCGQRGGERGEGEAGKQLRSQSSTEAQSIPIQPGTD